MKYFMSIKMNNECCTYYLNLRKFKTSSPVEILRKLNFMG